MKKKSMLLFVVIFTIIFAIFVSIKFFDRNKLVQLSSEFSLESGQFVKVANKEYTSIKLVSISNTCADDICSGNQTIEYNLLVNGDKYTISSIPSSVDIYEGGKLEVVDGDEDRIVLKVTESK